MRYFRTLLACTALLIPVRAAVAQANAENEGAVRSVIVGLTDAWNRHDMKAFAQLCAEDADYVDISGTDEKGRAEIERHHTEIHAGRYKDSLLTATSVGVRFLRLDVALAHVAWEVVYGQGQEKRTAFQTLVLTKEGNHWLIAAAHNSLTSGPPPAPATTPK